MTKLAKHKLIVSVNDNINEYYHKKIFKSVRSKVLQKFLLLYYNYWVNHRSSFYKELNGRCRKKGLVSDHKGNIASVLKPEDIMKLFDCSKRTVYDYVSALKVLLFWE